MIGQMMPNRISVGACAASGSSNSAFFRGASVCSRQSTAKTSRCQVVAVESRYKGKNTDMSKAGQFKRHSQDTGSSEYQVSVLTARISQLSTHMQNNRKDFSTRRGLEALLSRRRHFMKYLYKTNRAKYEHAIKELNIRPLRIQAGKGVVVRQTEAGLVVESGTASEAASGKADEGQLI